MSRQFSFYLLPSDITQLVERLRSRLNIRLLRPFTQTASTVEIESPHSDLSGEAKSGIDCYIARESADVRLRYIETRSIWHIADQSEVIEFTGCEFDGQILLIGRFYFQANFLADGMIVPKKKEFIVWADRVFRLAKNSLRYSKSLNAYVGEHADKWKVDGGRFAWMITPDRGPLYAEE